MAINFFMSIPLNHARHNKAAFDYLDKANSYPDWVITTAFYCAMHYAYAVIFPFTEVSVTYKNIEEYYNKHKRVGDTKHSLTLALIQKKHALIAEKYKQLKDTAHAARYQDYTHPQPVVSKMKRNLRTIEEYCERICSESA
jgi:hypothetical protein